MLRTDNVSITLQHLNSLAMSQLSQRDPHCKNVLEELKQQLNEIKSAESENFQFERSDVENDEIRPAQAKPNQRLIDLLTNTYNSIAADKNIKSSIKAKMIRHLRTLQLYLINEEAYAELGIYYNDTLSTVDCSSAFATYFDPEAYFDVTEANEIDSFSLVFVSGISPNPHGHVLLKLGNKGYLHIYALYDKPLFIPQAEFGDFLKKSGQTLLGIQQIHVPDIESAQKKLCQLAENKWLWLMYKNNCEDFAEQVLRAGGASCAQLDPKHLGDYYGHTAYPFKRFDALPQEHFILTTNDLTVKERKKTVHSQHKEAFRRIGREQGFAPEKAKEYARYRLKEGLSHRDAQYKTEPSFKHFLMRHTHMLAAVCSLNPLAFAIVAPVLIYFEVSVLYQNIKKHPFFSHKENVGHSARSLSAADLAEAATLRP